MQKQYTAEYLSSIFYSVLLLGILFGMCSNAYAAEYYVSPDGSTQNSGLSHSSPWPLQYASDNVNPGDTVYLMNGTFTGSNHRGNVLTVEKGGGSGAYITYKPAPDHKPIIKAGGSGVWGAVVIDAPYIRFENLEIVGDNANLNLSGARAAYDDARAGGQDWDNYGRYNTSGIGIGGRDGNRPHHVEVVGCRIHDFSGGGVQVTSADYVTIENNIIYNNAWYTMYAESGVSIFHSFNHDDADVYRMIVRGNEVYNNYTQIPWIDVRRLSDGNGIIIDDNRNTQESNTNNYVSYTGKILVENNVAYDNGGGGVNVFLSDNVDVVNNTTYGNGKIVGYPEIRFNQASNGRAFNNITFARDGVRAYEDLNSNNITSDYNIYYGGETNGLGPHDLRVNPKFTDLSGNDFTLQASSRGIDSGGGVLKAADDIEGVARPQGDGHDRGAYEKVSQSSGSQSSGGPTRSPYVPRGYKLSFADEFNSFDLDVDANGAANWAPYWVGWNVRHLEGNADEALKADYSYTGLGDTPLAKRLHRKTANNTLKLYGRWMPREKRQQFYGFPYLGGMISGQLSHSQKYGYWEVRTRLPNISKGHHIAFWLLSDDNSWPPEIDMLEVVGSDPANNTDAARFHFNSHGPNQGDISWEVSDRPKDWHVLGFLWTATDMVWYLDGKEVRRRPNYVFDKQFYFLASPEIGGNWPGNPDRSTVWPMEVEIDYVRVYQK